MNLPPDVSAVLEALDHNEKRARDLTSVDDASLQWHAGGAWSIAQCIDHLTNANRAYLSPMGEAAKRALAAPEPRRGPIAPGFIARWFVRSMEPPVTRRMRAPGKIKPSPQPEGSTVWPAFQASQAEVRRLLLELAQLDLNGVRFANPFIRGVRMTLGTGFLVLAAHQRRHLWQAENVRRQAAAV